MAVRHHGFFPGFPWRFIVTTLGSETVTSLERLAANRAVTFRLNQPATTTGRVPSDDPRVNITDIEVGLDAPHLSFSDRLMYGFRREQTDPSAWVCRFSGIVTQIQDQAQADQPYSTYTAYDPWQYLFHLPVVTDGEGSLPTSAGYVFPGAVPSNLIALTLFGNAVSSFFGGDAAQTHIDAGVSYGGTASWNGTVETTATVTDFTVQQSTSLGEAWRQLVATGAMDIVLTPVYDPVNRPGYCCDLSIYTEAGTVQDGAVFSWDVGRSVSAITNLLDGDQLANTVQFYSGQGGPAVTPQTDATSETRYGPYWAQQFWPASPGQAAYVETQGGAPA